MALPTPMPEADGEELGISQLFKRLFGDGVRVVEAELMLARHQTAVTMRRYFLGLLVGLAALATLSVALFVLAQAAAIAMQNYFRNPAFAFLVVGLALVLMATGLALMSRRLFAHRPPSIGGVIKQMFRERVAK